MKKTLLSLSIIFVLTFQLNAKTIAINEEVENTLIEITTDYQSENYEESSVNCHDVYADVLRCEMNENGKTQTEAQAIARNAFYACRQQQALQQIN